MITRILGARSAAELQLARKPCHSEITMDLSDFDLALKWPKELFLWEATRISSLQEDDSYSDMIAHLLREAFADDGLAEAAEKRLDAFEILGGAPNPRGTRATQILDQVLEQPDNLRQYQAPQYWLERHRGVQAEKEYKELERAFGDLVEEMAALGYFPGILPKPCFDDGDDIDPSEVISQAVRADVFWPIDMALLDLPDDVLYSVIEYFHDQVRRPSTSFYHAYGECGWHYSNHNKLSGQAVYRWRVNSLLESYDVGLRLGREGAETGRLIRYASPHLNQLESELIENFEQTEDTRIADAIHLYRSRGASINDRRAAVAQLAGYLERHRRRLKDKQFTKGDEADLFNIFNNFSLRHDNARQKSDYGDEYLDWIFWTTLAAIQLLHGLDQRES